MKSMNSTSPLTRSSTDRKLGGVAARPGPSLGHRPHSRPEWASRVSLLFSGVGLVAYLVMLAVVPSDDAMPAAASPSAR